MGTKIVAMAKYVLFTYKMTAKLWCETSNVRKNFKT